VGIDRLVPHAVENRYIVKQLLILKSQISNRLTSIESIQGTSPRYSQWISKKTWYPTRERIYAFAGSGWHQFFNSL